MRKNLLKSAKGFSLIELMVVVAIIGILASVAIPNFQRFQRKSKQAEARTNLAGVYTAEQAFKVEWNKYTGDFAAIGYAPDGDLQYSVGFTAVGVTPNTQIAGYSGPTAPTLFNSPLLCATLGTCNHIGAIASPAVAQNAAQGCLASLVPNNVAGAGARFVASAAADIGGGQADHWSIGIDKRICNNQDGISD